MKALRDDATHRQLSAAQDLEPEEERRRGPRGEELALSAADMAAFRGRRASQLDPVDREAVADQALAGASGTVPHRSLMEERFGRSFDDVRVADSAVSRATLDVAGADGVARDNHVAFREASPSKEAVAHELAHVVQAKEGAGTGDRDQAERQAYGVEAQLRAGRGIDLGAAGAARGTAHFRDESDWFHKQGFPKPVAAEPDEHPVDWRSAFQTPPDPIKKLDCVVKGDAPPAPAHDGARPDVCHDNHHRQEPHFDSKIGDVRRDLYWGDLRTAGVAAQKAHNGLADQITQFRHAEKDEQLQALGFILPGKSWKGDLAALADQQSTPKQGGTSVGALFDGHNQLKLNKKDQAGISAAANARAAGKGGVEGSMLGTIEADNGVAGALANARKAAHELKGASEHQRAAVSGIKVEIIGAKIELKKDEIAALQDEAQNSTRFIAACFAIGHGMVFAASGNLGNTIKSVGAAAEVVLERSNDDKIRAAKAELTTLKRQLHSTKAKELHHELESANEAVRGALDGIEDARTELLKALTERRKAYNTLGTSAAESAGTNAPSKSKIAATLAAIPIVEIVLARARTIASDAEVPPYTESAGRGLGMGIHHRYPQAVAFLRACGELNSSKTYFQMVQGEWHERLDALLAVKETIGGPRPDPNH